VSVVARKLVGNAGCERNICVDTVHTYVNIVHVGRPRHQRKEVEKALQHAEAEGCSVEVRHKGHTWGHVVAPNGQRLAVWSTPKNADVSARMIRRFVTRNRTAEG